MKILQKLIEIEIYKGKCEADANCGSDRKISL